MLWTEVGSGHANTCIPTLCGCPECVCVSSCLQLHSSASTFLSAWTFCHKTPKPLSSLFCYEYLLYPKTLSLSYTQCHYHHHPPTPDKHFTETRIHENTHSFWKQIWKHLSGSGVFLTVNQNVRQENKRSLLGLPLWPDIEVNVCWTDRFACMFVCKCLGMQTCLQRNNIIIFEIMAFYQLHRQVPKASGHICLLTIVQGWRNFPGSSYNILSLDMYWVCFFRLSLCLKPLKQQLVFIAALM